MPCRNDYGGGNANDLARNVPNSLGPPPLSETVIEPPYSGAALATTGTGSTSIVVIDEDSYYRFVGKKAGVNTLIIRGEWSHPDFIRWGSTATEGQPSFSLDIRTGMTSTDASVVVDVNGVISEPLVSGSYTYDIPPLAGGVTKLIYTILLRSSNRSGAFAAVGPLTLRYYSSY